MRMIMLALAASALAGCTSAPRTTTTIAMPETVATDIPSSRLPSERVRELALHALSYVGVPYRNGGSSPETGFDCSGLVHYVYRRGAGLVLPRNTEALSTIGAPVSPAELEPGDLVFFDTLRKPYSHVGIYLGEQRFIHAPSTGGQVELVDMRSRYWQTRYSGARRISL